MKKMSIWIVFVIALAAIPGWATDMVSPMVVLTETDGTFPPAGDLRIYSAPMVLGNVFFDGLTPDAWMLSTDTAQKKLIKTDDGGNAVTYVESNVLAGISARSGLLYGADVVVTMDYWPEGGSYYDGLYSVLENGTFNKWLLSQGHGGSNSLAAGVKNSLFLPAPLPEGIDMDLGISGIALRSNYTFGPVGSLFFDSAGTLYVLTGSPNRKQLAWIDQDGASGMQATSDALVGNNYRAGAPYGNGFVISFDYAPGSGSGLSGLYTLNNDGIYAQWPLNQGHGGISDLIAAPQGGYYFTDFENDSLWYVTASGQAETKVLTPSPIALMSVGINNNGDIAAVNWKPGEWWSNGGINAIYRISGAYATLAAVPPEGGQFFAIAGGKGGIFGNDFYITDPPAGKIYRLTSDNTLTTVISGLPNPGRLRFDPITGNMVVVCDGEYLLWFGDGLTPFDPMSESTQEEKGVFFSDFENDNVWFVPAKGSPEIPILESNVPPGLGTIAYNDINDTIYALNWQGGWPFGGEDSVYAIHPNGTATQILKGNYASIAMSKGGVFGQNLYLSDPTNGRIVRMDDDGSITEVISGLTSPGSMSFCPVSGNLAVICDSGKSIAWIGSNLEPAAGGEPGTVGDFFIPAEQAFIEQGDSTITGTEVRLELDDTLRAGYYSASKKGYTGDFDFKANIVITPKTLLNGQNRDATIMVRSDVAGQWERQIAYIGFYQKTVGYMSTGGQYYAYTDMMINGGWGRFNNRNLSGKTNVDFRITRQGGIISTFLKENGAWVKLSTTTNQGFSDRVRFYFNIGTSWESTMGVTHSAVFNTNLGDTDDDGDLFTENEGDCDDGNSEIYPGATEICGDGIDQDCSGSDLACIVHYDLDHDDDVDIVDIMMVAARWNTAIGDPNYDASCDLDDDGDIDIVDIMMVAAQWGWTE